MSDPTRDEVLKSIEPKSDQMNADDLLTGPKTVTITKVSRGDREQPIVVSLEGLRPYKPCKSMRRILIAAYSDDPSKWIGQRMTLYCDPEVTWAGVKVGGIRISHLSGIGEPKTFLLTQTRGKKAEVTILPLADLSDEDKKFLASAVKEIEETQSLELLKATGKLLGEKSDAVRDALRPVYAKRMSELESKTKGEI